MLARSVPTYFSTSPKGLNLKSLLFSRRFFFCAQNESEKSSSGKVDLGKWEMKMGNGRQCACTHFSLLCPSIASTAVLKRSITHPYSIHRKRAIRQMKDAANELNQAVHQLFEIGNTHDRTKTTRLHGNTYERKRCLRRIERAVLSLQDQLTNISDDSGEESDFVGLDDISLEPLMDVITEFPKLECSQSDALREVYDSVISIAGSLLHQYASMPLSANHVDRLLDRIATLALMGQVDINILQLLNSSLLHYEHVAGSDQSCDHNGQNADCDDEIEIGHSDHGDDGGEHGPYSASGNNAPPRGSIILNAAETFRLTQILMPLSLKHLSQAWAFPVSDDEDGGRSVTQHNELSTWKSQHGGLQLRVLMSFLLPHFINEVDKIDSIEFGNNESPIEKLQYIAFHYFQKELVDRDGAECSSEALAMVEDYIDLITSFLVENIEYAIDAIDASSHSLHQHSASSNDCETRSSGNLENEIGSNHRYIKDTIRLTSLAIGMIELFHEDLGLPWETYNSHAVKLLEDFASFVAVFCTEGVLMHAHGSSDTIASGDKALMKLWSILRDLSSANKIYLDDHQSGSMLGNPDTSGSKRRRLLPNENSEAKMESSLGSTLDMTMVTTVLRAFPTCSSDEAAMDLIRRELDIAKDGILHPKMEMKGLLQSDSAKELSSLVQACALSTLLAPQEDSYENNESYEGGLFGFNGGLLSTLVDPLVASIEVEDKDADDPVNDPVYGVVDAMNPWNYMLSRSLSSKLSFLDAEYSDPGKPMRVVTTSSTSSVSDLRSHNTSSTSKRNRGKRGEAKQSNTSSILDDLLRFSQAVEHVTTL